MNPINIPWLLLLAYWVISAFSVRKNQRVESIGSRLLVSGLIVGSILIVVGPWLHESALDSRFVPSMPLIRDAGIVLLWAGVGIAIWARYHLGEYWSGRVTIKVGHKLIDTGPYRYVRHPIYSGILLAMIGTALATGKWRSVVAFALVLIVLFMKMRKEEQFLSEELRETYRDYKRRTGMLIPRFPADSA